MHMSITLCGRVNNGIHLGVLAIKLLRHVDKRIDGSSSPLHNAVGRLSSANTAVDGRPSPNATMIVKIIQTWMR